MSIPRFIYFARRADGSGPIKIGCSCGPKIRLHQLAIDIKAPLTLLVQAPGDFTLERNLHHKFRHLHEMPAMSGDCRPEACGLTEWFAASPELLAFVEEVRRTGAIPLPDNERLECIFIRRFAAGETLRAIGVDFGLSHERVRQVLREHGYPTSRHELRYYLAALAEAA